MRFQISAVAAIALASAFAGALPAGAADYPVLRGTSSPSLPPAPMIKEDAAPWDGFYIGGFAGTSSVTFDPKTGAADLASSSVLVRNTELTQLTQTLQPGPFSARGVGYGGFLGYNMQFGEALIGFEADYTAIRKGGSNSVATIGRIRDIGSQRIGLDFSGSSEAKLNDLVTLRMRAGYVMGTVMPYLTGGLALGYGEVTNRADLTREIAPILSVNPTVVGAFGPPVSDSLIEKRTNAFMMGFSGGAGVEAMYGGLLVRAEYLFSRLQSQGGVVVDVNQARVGAGVKF
jgi:outer membrane immunogenic protein